MLRCWTSRLGPRALTLTRRQRGTGLLHQLSARLVLVSMGSSKGKPTDPKLREKVVEGKTVKLHAYFALFSGSAHAHDCL